MAHPPLPPAQRGSAMSRVAAMIGVIVPPMIVLAAAVTCDAQVAGGLQLRLGEPGKNTELLTETESMLYLSVSIENLSGTPVSMDFTQATYDFEYEIDGTWYAF